MTNTKQPRRTSSNPIPPLLKKSSSGSQSSKSQQSITGFFQTRPVDSPQANQRLPSRRQGLANSFNGSVLAKEESRGSSSSLTPAPSSDALEELDLVETMEIAKILDIIDNGLPSPVTPAGGAVNGDASSSPNLPLGFSSPSRKVFGSFLWI